MVVHTVVWRVPLAHTLFCAPTHPRLCVQCESGACPFVLRGLSARLGASWRSLACRRAAPLAWTSPGHSQAALRRREVFFVKFIPTTLRWPIEGALIGRPALRLGTHLHAHLLYSCTRRLVRRTRGVQWQYRQLGVGCYRGLALICTHRHTRRESS